MPLYCYRCKACGFSFEVWHSMSFKDQTCSRCESEDVFKVPSLSDKVKISPTNHRPGKIVDDYIEKTKEEVKKEKKKLKSEEM